MKKRIISAVSISIVAFVIVALVDFSPKSLRIEGEEVGENRMSSPEAPKVAKTADSEKGRVASLPHLDVYHQRAAQRMSEVQSDEATRQDLLRRLQNPENMSGIPLDFIPEGVTRVEQVLFHEFTEPDERGLRRRSHVLKTDFHFPLLQTVELLETDDQTGEQKVVAYKAMVADHLMVQTEKDLLPDNWRSLLAEKGIGVRRKVTAEGLYLLDFAVNSDREALTRMDQLAGDFSWIRYAEPDFLIARRTVEDPIPNDPLFEELWGLRNTGQQGGTVGKDIKAVDAWRMQQTNPAFGGVAGAAGSAIVAVLDTGVDYRHLDLAENMWVNPHETRNGRDDNGNGIIDDIHGANMVTGTGDPMDWHSHGTHVAGTVGAVGHNNLGVVGVAWDVQIMAVTILYPGGTLSDIVRGIDYAWQNGAHVLNNSWGVILFNARLFGAWRSQAMIDAVLRTRDAGAIFVTAAGNDFTNVDIFANYPADSQAHADNVVNVAALDRQGNLAFFSNYGPNNVQIGAPGHEILSTVPGNGYAVFSGTSMAAPHVAGMLAVIKHEYPNESYRTQIQRLLQRGDKDSHLAHYIGIGRRANLARALDPKPLIDDPLTDFEFLPGRDISLRIGVSASGGPSTVQWFKNGVLLPGETGLTLPLGQGDRSLNGVYRAEVTNPHGTSVTEAVVRKRPVHPELGEILGAPGLTWTSSVSAPWVPVAEPVPSARSGGISHNEKTEISTLLKGPGTLSFSWKVSSEANYDLARFSLGGSVKEAISGESGWLSRSHRIPHGLHAAIWSYAKDPGRSLGDDAAWLANVSYVSDHPVIESQTGGLELAIGSSATLSITAHGSGSLTYHWTKDGSLLGGKNEPQLEIGPVSASDAGRYVATVSNSHGSASSFPMIVSVVESANAPVITRQPENFVGREGAPLVLSAAWRGTSPVSFQWFKNGTELPGETGSALGFRRLTMDHAGVYHLLIANEAGSVESFPATVRVFPARKSFADWVTDRGGIEIVRNAEGGIPGSVFRYALGVGPDENLARRMPSFRWAPEPTLSLLALASDFPDGGPVYGALVFERPSYLEGVSFSLEASGDLVSWEPSEAVEEILELDESGRELVQLRELVPSSPDQARRFLRLRIEVEE